MLDDSSSPPRIRAVQGHSIPLEQPLLEPVLDAGAVPLAVHITSEEGWAAIQASGELRAMSRTHVHFATEPRHLRRNAWASVLLRLDLAAAMAVRRQGRPAACQVRSSRESQFPEREDNSFPLPTIPAQLACTVTLSAGWPRVLQRCQRRAAMPGAPACPVCAPDRARGAARGLAWVTKVATIQKDRIVLVHRGLWKLRGYTVAAATREVGMRWKENCEAGYNWLPRGAAGCAQRDAG